jgi:mannitol-1-/sugar-/sorbitol-6-/2-deoxyglucose-6-phosphatase
MTVHERRFDAVVFDMDGLLVDSEPVWHEAEIEVFGHHGVVLTAEMCRQTKGKYVLEAVLHWYERYRWDGPSPELVAEEIIAVMEARLEDHLELKAGAAHAVEFFARLSLPMALASSSPRRLIDVVLRRPEFDGAFGVVCSGEDEVAGKPDPAIFLTAARLMGVEPGRCVVFEDSPAGVRAATSAGMICVAVPEGPWRQRDDAGAYDLADVVLRSLTDIDQPWWSAMQSLLI